jgi:DNA-directed RNA polymerase specialized sigma24 family protein
MLKMRYEGSMSFEAIARETGRTAGAVQRAISRLRMALKDCISMKMETA